MVCCGLIYYYQVCALITIGCCGTKNLIHCLHDQFVTQMGLNLSHKILYDNFSFYFSRILELCWIQGNFTRGPGFIVFLNP